MEKVNRLLTSIAIEIEYLRKVEDSYGRVKGVRTDMLREMRKSLERILS